MQVALTLRNFKEFIYYKDGTLFRRKNDKPLGALHHSGYLVVQADKKQMLVHRLVWFFFHREMPDGIIDHINRNKTDNRIENLRVANFSLNGANRKVSKTNTSGYKGVHPSGSKWLAMIHKDGKPIYLGTYETPEIAHRAYCEKAYEIYGEFHFNGTEAANLRAEMRMG